MPCKCNENKPPRPAEEAPVVQPSRLAIHCFCGLTRLIPAGLKVNDTFELVPCPKCGSGFRGKLVDQGVEEVL